MPLTRFGLRIGLVLGATLLGQEICAAAPITYQVSQAIGLGSVTGTIETDGGTGALATSNIIAFDLNLNGVGATYHLTSATGAVQVVGNDVTATPTGLLFNFSGSDDGYLLFQQTLFSGMHYYCDATATDTCYQGASVVPGSFNDPSAQNVSQIGNQMIGTAVAAVPEPVSIALLGTGLLGLVGWNRLRRHRDCSANAI